MIGTYTVVTYCFSEKPCLEVQCLDTRELFSCFNPDKWKCEYVKLKVTKVGKNSNTKAWNLKYTVNEWFGCRSAPFYPDWLLKVGRERSRTFSSFVAVITFPITVVIIIHVHRRYQLWCELGSGVRCLHFARFNRE